MGRAARNTAYGGMELLHSERIQANSFNDEHGNLVQINTLWQVWKRGVNNIQRAKTCGNWIELFTVDNRQERLSGTNS